MIKNIIFDWSGTISNDLVPCYNAIMGIFKEFGKPEISLTELRTSYDLPWSEFYYKYGIKAENKKLVEIFSKYFKQEKKPKIFKGMKKALIKLKGKKINLAVLSAHSQQLQEKELEEYGLLGIFDSVLASVIDKREKIEGFLKENNFKAEETAYIGDLEHDIETAKKAGVKSVAVCWGWKPKEYLKKNGPDLVLEKVEYIARIPELLEAKKC